MTDYRRLTHCRLCDAALPEPFLDLGETALANELATSPDQEQQTYPLQLVQCSECEHVQLSIAVDPKRLFPPDYPYQSGTSPVFREHLKGLAEVVRKSVPVGDRGNVLDIGCNDGTLMSLMVQRGLGVWGIDPAADSGVAWAEYFTARWAHEHRVFLDDMGGCRYHAITALNVFAHVDDLHDFTAGVAELLADDGVFIFEVGYLPDVVEKGLLGCIYHEHVSYHHLRPLFRFFPKHGLELVDAHRVDSQGGSVRCFVKRANNFKDLKSGLTKLMVEESKLDVGKLWLQTGKLALLGAKLHRAAQDGQRIAGYGAPAKLTTLSRQMSSDTRDLECIFDDNPLKVGKYTPGTHIPIVSSSELMERNPDALVLFSANFADEIKSRFPDYRGEWIIP